MLLACGKMWSAVPAAPQWHEQMVRVFGCCSFVCFGCRMLVFSAPNRVFSEFSAAAGTSHTRARVSTRSKQRQKRLPWCNCRCMCINKRAFTCIVNSRSLTVCGCTLNFVHHHQDETHLQASRCTRSLPAMYAAAGHQILRRSGGKYFCAAQTAVAKALLIMMATFGRLTMFGNKQRQQGTL